jgi:membrane protease subunit HflC
MMRAVIGILLGLALVTFLSCMYTVDEREQVLVTLFGEVVGEQTEAGLKFKGPFFWKVERFPKWVMEWDGDPSQIPTRDKKYIHVDTFGRWRIVDVQSFYESVRNETGAQTRLDDIIDGATRDVVTDHDLIEIVRNSNAVLARTEEGGYGSGQDEAVPEIKYGREELAQAVFERASPPIREKYGIELLDVQFKRINYISDVQEKVFERMISERERIAELFRAEGRKAAAEIRGRQERELKRIDSEAYREAEELKGTADAEATAIYAEAFNRDIEFYTFLRSLESYRHTLGEGDTIVLDTEGDYFQYLESVR